MKVPHKALDDLSHQVDKRRRDASEEQARKAASALAREAAAAHLISGIATLTAGGSDASPHGPRLRVRQGPAVIDRIFDHLARSTLSAPWEELAQAADAAGAPELGNAVDRLARTRGTVAEVAARVEVAIEAIAAKSVFASARDELPDQTSVCTGLAPVRALLRNRPRVRVTFGAREVVFDGDQWLVSDDEGETMAIRDAIAAATIGAILATESARVEAVALRDEQLGPVLVPALVSTDSGTEAILAWWDTD